MLIISWNCSGAFRKKCKQIIEYDCDIMIVQECENPGMKLNTQKNLNMLMPNYIWVGDIK